MYKLDANELIRARARSDQLLQRSGRGPITVPLGRDSDDLFNYLVVTVKPNQTHSEHVAKFGVAGGDEKYEIAGCTCNAGEHDNHCRHVADAYPVHRTFILIENIDDVYRMVLGERSKR
ncbi:MAG: hypothetical protein V7638_3897 [Acidobacteriota bacterium]|jgi:hypothetical protein